MEYLLQSTAFSATSISRASRAGSDVMITSVSQCASVSHAAGCRCVLKPSVSIFL